MTQTEFAEVESRLAQEGVSFKKLIADELADRQRIRDIEAYENLFRWVASINEKVDRLIEEKHLKEPPAPAPKIASPYLTAEEAAAYLRLNNVKKIYGLIERGRLKRLPGSRKLRFTIELLDEYLRGE